VKVLPDMLFLSYCRSVEQGFRRLTVARVFLAFTQVRQQAAAVKTYTADEIAKGAKTGQWDALNKQNGAVLRSAAGVAAPETTSAKSSNTTGNPASSNDVMPGSRLADE
jgi:hypothetical protein